MMAVAADWAAVATKPSEKITLRQGACDDESANKGRWGSTSPIRCEWTWRSLLLGLARASADAPRSCDPSRTRIDAQSQSFMRRSCSGQRYRAYLGTFLACSSREYSAISRR